jgi:hypothetical protein
MLRRASANRLPGCEQSCQGMSGGMDKGRKRIESPCVRRLELAVAKTVRCPLCAGEAAWDQNPWRPFCSERCQLTDLGSWAAEWYRVPGQSLATPATFQDSDDDATGPSDR